MQVLTVDQTLNNTAAETAKQLLEWLQKFGDKADVFVASETPILIQEYLSYSAIVALLGFIMGVIFIIITGIFAFKGIKLLRKDTLSDFGFGCIMTATIMFIIALPLLIVNGSSYLKIKMAPRLVVVEKMGDILKQIK